MRQVEVFHLVNEQEISKHSKIFATERLIEYEHIIKQRYSNGLHWCTIQDQYMETNFEYVLKTFHIVNIRGKTARSHGVSTSAAHAKYLNKITRNVGLCVIC